MRRQAQRLLDHAEEPVGVADQVVGLALGHRATEPASAAARLPAPAAKNAAHSASSGATSASRTQAFFCGRRRVGGGRPGPGGQQRGRGPQRGDVGAGVAGGHLGRGHRLAQRLRGAGEVGVGGRGQQWSSVSSRRRSRSVRAADERPATLGPVEGEVEDPADGRLLAARVGAGRPRPASTRHSSRSVIRSPSDGPRAGSRAGPRLAVLGADRPARASGDCHHGPVSTQWASTARTFHSRPRHRNCSGPSTRAPDLPAPRAALAHLDRVGVPPHRAPPPRRRSNTCSNDDQGTPQHGQPSTRTARGVGGQRLAAGSTAGRAGRVPRTKAPVSLCHRK